MVPSVIVAKAQEDASIWWKLNQNERGNSSSIEDVGVTTNKWKKPPIGFVKCNVGTSWSDNSRHSGASWIVKDFRGKALEHSRRALLDMRIGLEADITSLKWELKIPST